tara:strand:+ start:497 stop:1399 length:903 start_codon:yes stop_codon:yes gene_type:complete
VNDLEKIFTFIIGAQKSGTTAVHNLLLSHPEVSLPKIKETHYFSKDSLYDKNIDWYYSHFNFKKKAICEVDPSYLFFPNTAQRIKESIPNSRFIVIFRKPIDRALSQYLMSCYRGYETLSFLNALNSEKERLKNDKNQFSFINHSYLQRGNYLSQLEEYLSIFDKSNFLFIKFDDLISDDENVLKSICTFIDIDFTLLQFTLPKSNIKRKIKSAMIRNLLYKESFFKKTAQFMIPSDELRNKLKNIINSLNSSDYNQNESKDEINKHLKLLPQEYIDWNNNQTKLLSKISNLNLDDWIYT